MSLKKISLTVLGALQLAIMPLTLAVGVGVIGAAVSPVATYAACTEADPNNPGETKPVLTLDCGTQTSKATGQTTNLFGNTGFFKKLSDTLIYIVGAVSVLFVIIGGLRYVISNGDAKAVESAKNTILYAIIGVVVSIIAFAAVHFVVQSIG